MSKIGYREAFKRYGAVPRNSQWAFSAVAEDGAIVLSCWEHYLKLAENGVQRYTDTLSRRKHKIHGAPLLEEHLKLALKENRVIRLIVAYTKEIDVVDRGNSAAAIRKDFDVRPDLIGRLVDFDGDRYVMTSPERPLVRRLDATHGSTVWASLLPFA